MFNADALVSAWLISKWVEGDGRNYGSPTYSYDEHGPVTHLRVRTADAEWECGCYSSWTREDDFVMTAVIATAAGDVEFKYGRWSSFPSFIKELDEYRNNTVCTVENREGY